MTASTFETEKTCLRMLCDEARKRGYRPVRVDFGFGDGVVKVKNTEQAVNHATSIDMSNIEFEAESEADGPISFAVTYVGGNGTDCIADYAYKQEDRFWMDDLIHAVYDRVEARFGA